MQQHQLQDDHYDNLLSREDFLRQVARLKERAADRRREMTGGWTRTIEGQPATAAMTDPEGRRRSVLRAHLERVLVDPHPKGTAAQSATWEQRRLVVRRAGCVRSGPATLEAPLPHSPSARTRRCACPLSRLGSARPDPPASRSARPGNAAAASPRGQAPPAHGPAPVTAGDGPQRGDARTLPSRQLRTDDPYLDHPLGRLWAVKSSRGQDRSSEVWRQKRRSGGVLERSRRAAPHAENDVRNDNMQPGAVRQHRVDEGS